MIVYPNCIQLEVTGGGDKLPTAGTVSLPGGYKPDEPGMVFNIYTEGAFHISSSP